MTEGERAADSVENSDKKKRRKCRLQVKKKREKRNGGKEKGSGLREKGAEKGALIRFTPVDPS